MIAARTIDETVSDLAALQRSGSAEAATALARIAGGIPREEAIADLIDQLADLAENVFDDDALAFIEKQRFVAENAAADAENAADEIRDIVDKIMDKKGAR